MHNTHSSLKVFGLVIAEAVINFIFLLCLVLGLVGLMGCSTTSGSRGDDLVPLVKTAAYVGTFYGLQEHPSWRPGFQLAAQQLRTLETQENVDFTNLMAIVHRLPVQELKSDRASIIVTSATILLSQYGGDAISIDNLNNLKPIVVAIREGVELGLVE